METKFLSQIFEKVKEYYSLSEQVTLVDDFVVDIKVFRDCKLYDLIIAYDEQKLEYSDYLCKLFSVVVVKINDVDVAGLVLKDDADKNLPIAEYLEKMASENLDVNLLSGIDMVVRRLLLDLNKKASDTVKSASLDEILKASSEEKEKIGNTKSKKSSKSTKKPIVEGKKVDKPVQVASPVITAESTLD